MAGKRSRRDLLILTGTSLGLTGLSGCVIGGFNNPPGGGDLIIDNNDPNQHSITVSIARWSDDNRDASRDTVTPPPEETPRWSWEERFAIEGEGELVRRDIITEPGAYFVEGWLENDEHDDIWLDLYSAGNQGEDVGGAAIAIEIHNDRVFLGLYRSD